MRTNAPEPHSDPRPSRRLLWLALIVHACLATAYAFSTPAYEGPDENDHVYYAYFLRSTGELPIVKDSAEAVGRTRWDEAVLAHHPPLYYLLQTVIVGDRLPAWRLNPAFGTDAPGGALHKLHGADETVHVSGEIDALRRMRLLSVACGLGSVLLTWRIARRIWPDRPSIADASALLLACVPQWSFVHGTVENGNLATTLALGATLALVTAVVRRELTPPRGLAVGVLVGAALLTKLTSIFLLPLCALVWAIALLRWPARGRTLVAGVVALVAILAITGWFFWRNWQLYADPLGLNAHEAAFAGNRLADVAAASGRPLGEVRLEYLTGDFVSRTVQTAISGFGWAGVRAQFAEWLAVALAVLAAAGWLRHGRAIARGRGPALVVLLAAIALVTVSLVRFNWMFVQPQGRYLFPAFGPIVVLLAAGAVAIVAPWSARLRGVAPALLATPVALGFAAFALVASPALDPHLAPAPSSLFASLVAGVTTPPERPSLSLITPADGASVSTPATLTWSAVDAPDARYTVHLVLPSGLGLGSFESAGVELDRPSWTLPPALWSGLPEGQPIRWKVRRLPDRARGEEPEDVAESAFGTFVRAP